MFHDAFTCHAPPVIRSSPKKARCIWCCTCHKTQPLWQQQQQPKQQQQQQQAPCSSSSKAKNTIVKERTWFNLVANEIVLHPLHLGTGALLHSERVVAVREEPTRTSRILTDTDEGSSQVQDLLLWTSLLCQWVCRWLVMSWRDPMEKYFRDSGIVKCNVGVDPRILQWEGTQQIRQF